MKSGKNRMKTMKKVLHYLSGYRILLCCSLLFAALTVMTTLYLPILTGNVIDCILGPGKVDFPAIGHILFKMCILISVTALSQWIMSLCNNRIAYHVVRDLRRDVFRHIQELPLKYQDTHPAGETVSRVIADADQFSEGLLMGFSQLFTGVLTIAGTLFFMFHENAGITLVVVCITPVSLLAAGLIAGRTYHMFQKQSETRGEQTALIDEMIGNQKMVQAFRYEDDALERFDRINEKLGKYSLKATFLSSLTNPCTRFVNSLVYTGVGITGAISVINGGMTVGTLSCFLSYANQYTKPFNEISGVFAEFQNALACAGRIFDLLEEEAEIPEPEDAGTLDAPSGRILFEDVSFSYVPERPLIEHLNLKIHPGQKVAIVGPTGCGKTTLINLLMRFYDVDSGSVSVDGCDIRTLKRESLRSSFGMVLQDTWLKEGTVRENIIMGKPDASPEEIRSAAKASRADGFIRRLPQGYDTVLAEDGEGLSQGQKQLLCITRVMLCLPPMLILDEATSSIDTRTERKIQEAFTHMMKGRTSFIIAHRLSTIADADVILVMKDGNIIEQGTHEELLDRNGFYARLYESQFAVMAGEKCRK